MNMDVNGRRLGGGGVAGEDPIEVSRYLEALRRSRWLILTIVLVVTGGVLAFSVTRPKTYEATASIVVDNASGLLASNEQQTVQRNLQTTATLATTGAVLSEAANSVRGETRASLSKHVSASVAEDANIINIKVTYGNGAGAATLAYAVARSFLNQHAASERAQTATALSLINDQIASLRARAATEPTVARCARCFGAWGAAPGSRVEIVHGGTLVAYMGDGIFAVFGAPLEMSDHADRALDTAREMLDWPFIRMENASTCPSLERQ